MLRSVIVTLSLVAFFAIASAPTASAAKKMTYESAFAKCKQEISASVPGSDVTTSAARYTAGSACMRKYGFRLKKGSM